ncbi:hypothetical protein B0A49_00361 [Cryomyces minteri]|uniref:Uncharacterized protein n=1 Tax=Cryomyces minteri TaxID=331657 RepID=A0A4V5NI41_9PEZI|nr:hypothetical protein B0A49_00361 [Cryomyces minteri]
MNSARTSLWPQSMHFVTTTLNRDDVRRLLIGKNWTNPKQFYTSNSAYQRLGPTSREIPPAWNPLWDASKENSKFQYTQTMDPVPRQPTYIKAELGFVTNVVRWANEAEITAPTAQMAVIWNKLDPDFRT